MSFDVCHPVTSGPGSAFVYYFSTSNLLQYYLADIIPLFRSSYTYIRNFTLLFRRNNIVVRNFISFIRINDIASRNLMLFFRKSEPISRNSTPLFPENHCCFKLIYNDFSANDSDTTRFYPAN